MPRHSPHRVGGSCRRQGSSRSPAGPARRLQPRQTAPVTGPDELDVLLRLLLAAALGAAIGLERELSRQPAGFRTHLLVALGAALFAVAGTVPPGDPTRVAAQVVTGIGFLGGGAILRDRTRVKGLTTAASLWVTAAVGLAAGLGQAVAAAAGAALALLGLVLLKWLEGRLFAPRRGRTVELRLSPGADLSAVVQAAAGVLGQLSVRRVGATADGGSVVLARMPTQPGRRLVELAQALHDVPGVTGVDLAA